MSEEINYNDVDLEVLEQDLEEVIDDNMIEKVVSHPCEDLFDIEPNTTVMTVPAPRQTALAKPGNYDAKDQEIEEQYQEIYDKAMDAFDDIQEDMNGIEGKYKARNQEVGVALLNAALSAAKEKSRMKEHKDKLSGGKGATIEGSNNVINQTNNTIHMSTSDLIASMAKEQTPTNNYNPDAFDAQAKAKAEEEAEDAELVESESESEDSAPGKRTKIKRKKKTDEV